MCVILHKFFRAFVIAMAFLLCFTSVVHADESDVSAVSYIVMDADNGEVLLEKNADSIMYPASTTKMMTLAPLAGNQVGPRKQDIPMLRLLKSTAVHSSVWS